ncbi:hypothetical protein BDN72DRAFT_829838 [Pluteus cervinus]|uniref:Uncharacterized protein n=1 Tax=Pluteus cervinus TaxID=181527 RepID=A0ACD3BFN1_9AGAR|nr:hypothetical protein BDN72DRAFT_829838 [Pluteus cervinus]
MSLRKKQKSPEALRNVSGSVLNSRPGPSTFSPKEGKSGVGDLRSAGTTYRVRPQGSWQVEVIPDSEEERVQTLAMEYRLDEDVFGSFSCDRPSANAILDDPFEVNFSGACPAKSTSSPTKNVAASTWTPRSSPQITKTRKYHSSRRIMDSPGSDDSDDNSCVMPPREVIELTDSEPESPKPAPKPRSRKKATKEIQLSPVIHEKLVPLFLDDEFYDDNYGDDAILTLNEPKSARKPFQTPKATDTPAKGRPRKPAGASKKPNEDVFGTPDVALPGAFPEPASAVMQSPSTPPKKKTSAKAAQPSRTSKKAQAQAEQTRRRDYAIELFNDLNHRVFGDRLPQDTKLVWNNRLLTTAGRAKWHRSRDGVQTSEIELADKILDCDERIRNTLAHEMCHLASWIVDQAPTENHGRIWKAWALKVQRKRPEIEISTRHDYEISYKYQWKCQKCDKIYGRFSKSIDPEACLCGVCREGRLVPLFATRKTTRNSTPKTGRNAAEKGNDSPMTLTIHSIDVAEDDSDEIVEVTGFGPGATKVQPPTPTILDSDLDALTKAMGSIVIEPW